jgi:chromosome segregation ATPase
MENIEEKLKTEKQMTDLRRELKTLTFDVGEIKREYNLISSAKEKIEKQISEQKDYLTQVLNDISNAKLQWSLEKDGEMQKLSVQLTEAEKIISKKKELDEQETKIKGIKQENTNILNDNRRLELKLAQDKTVLESLKRANEDKEEEMKKSHNVFLKEKAMFKSKVSSLLKEFLNI